MARARPPSIARGEMLVPAMLELLQVPYTGSSALSLALALHKNKAKEILRARGVPVMFVRLPSSGAYLESERKGFPRERTWDVLLAQSGAPGVHFEDHPELQGYDTPEWSHLSADESTRFTAALHGVMARTVPSMVRRGVAK